MTNQAPQPVKKTSSPAGWYPELSTGRLRWWDGTRWGPFAPDAQPPAPQASQRVPQQFAPQQFSQQAPQHVHVKHDRYANRMPVSYVRKQQGHSIVKHLIWGIFCAYLNVIYISFSPNHYWHT